MRLEVERGPATWEPVVAWLGLPSVALGAAWLLLGLPTPACVFHRLTGLPCLTCGGTRCVRSALHGDWFGALAWNPLVFLSLIAVAVILAYATGVAVFRLPRLRVVAATPRDANACRLFLALAAAANWIYLIFRFSRLA